MLLEKLVRESVSTLSGQYLLYLLNEIHTSFNKLEDISEAKAVVSTPKANSRYLPSTATKRERLFRREPAVGIRGIRFLRRVAGDPDQD